MLDQPLSFGRYRLEPRGGLMFGGREVRLTPKALALLSFLAERPGKVVTKEELFAAVWPNTTVGDAALVTCIQEVRKALRDNARRPRYIETLHRRGYRFIGGNASSTARSRASAVSETSDLPLPDRPSIAVLPFANISDGPDQDYFADGISEDLITGLSRIRWLFVIARNSTFVYKGRAVDVKQVARQLGVRYVLEGSVRRAGKQLRISGSSTPSPAVITGPNGTIGTSATSSPCKMKSPGESSQLSNPVCSPRKAFARFRGPPTISEPGSSWLALKLMSGA